MRISRTGSRNHEIFLAFREGNSKEALAALYNVSTGHIEVILRSERHKIELSPELPYRQIRNKKLDLTTSAQATKSCQ